MQSFSFRRLIQSAMVLPGLLLLIPGAVVVYAGSPAIQDPAPAPALEETESFMGMPVGAFVRVKCTEPAIELNNAKLLAVARTTITVTTVNGERFTLPKDSTEVGAPVNWQRTATVLTPELNRSHSGARLWGWVVLLLLLAGAGVAAWLFVVRRAEAPSGAKFALPAASRAQSDQAPPPPLPKADSDSDGVDNLIESRCYGTAIERLEQQIKTQPGNFKLRLQLLKVYSIIGNKKQIDRVSHQIEFHPDFSPEQKRQAVELVAAGKEKEESKPQLAAPPPKTTAAPSRPLEQDRQVAEMIASMKAKEASKAQAAASPPQATAAPSQPSEQKQPVVERPAPAKNKEESKPQTAAALPQATAAPSRPAKQKRQAVDSARAKNREASKTQTAACPPRATATPSPQPSS